MTEQQVHRTTKEIESEINDTRTQMDATIDVLQERLSVRRLGRQARDAVQKRMPDPPSAPQKFYARRPMLMGGVALGLGLTAGFLLAPPASEGHTRTSSKSEGVRTGMAAKANEVKERTMEAVGNLRERAGQVTGAVREEGRELAEQTGASAKHIGDTAKEEASNVVREAKQSAKDVKEKTKEAQH